MPLEENPKVILEEGNLDEMTLRLYTAELHHKDLLSVVCRRQVMVYEGVGG